MPGTSGTAEVEFEPEELLAYVCAPDSDCLLLLRRLLLGDPGVAAEVLLPMASRLEREPVLVRFLFLGFEPEAEACWEAYDAAREG